MASQKRRASFSCSKPATRSFGIAHHNHIARSLTPSPAFGPEIEDVVQVNVGQERRDYRTLPRSPVADRHDPVFENARLQPFLDQADHARVVDPVFQEADQPFLADRIEEAPNVRIENVVHLLARDPDDECVQRIVLAALWPEPVREPEEDEWRRASQPCALPEPDVSLSTHPAPIISPLAPEPNGRIGLDCDALLSATNPRSPGRDPGTVCICEPPIAR